ncbi:MAG: hypothetical protein ACLS6G_04995 [Christensenellales bacterium]
MRSLSVLLCGYGWFAGIPEGETNNAELIARALDGETLVCGDVRATVRGMTMPVLWRGAFEPVQAAIDAQKLDLVLALGTDARAGALRPEPFGVNWRRGRDAGDTPEENSRSSQEKRNGCAARSLCADGARHARHRRARPARRADPAPADAPLTVQSTTGMYLCNYMTYRLAKLSRETGLRAGFMHVPTQTAYACRHRERMLAAAADEEAKEKLLAAPIAGMELEMMVKGTRAALEACLGE